MFPEGGGISGFIWLDFVVRWSIFVRWGAFLELLTFFTTSLVGEVNKSTTRAEIRADQRHSSSFVDLLYE